MVRRESELAEARAALALLEAGTRPEEIEAEKARHERLHAELDYLEGLARKTEVRSPQSGTVSTPHLDENVGRYYREGELVCLIEEPGRFEVEIDLDEQDVPCVRPGQPRELKVQGLPFETFAAALERVDPRADPPPPPPGVPPAPPGSVRGNVVVSCTLEGAAFNLRPGMTGHARITCGRRPLGAILAERLVRYLRNEFRW